MAERRQSHRVRLNQSLEPVRVGKVTWSIYLHMSAQQADPQRDCASVIGYCVKRSLVKEYAM